MCHVFVIVVTGDYPDYIERVLISHELLYNIARNQHQPYNISYAILN